MSICTNDTVADAWATWIDRWKWEWFATLTFSDEVSPKKAHNIWRDWLHELERAAERKVHYIRVTEKQVLRGGNPHYHALLMGVGLLSPSTWACRWREVAGLARIEEYDLELAGNYYISKSLDSPDSGLILSKGLEKVPLSR